MKHSFCLLSSLMLYLQIYASQPCDSILPEAIVTAPSKARVELLPLDITIINTEQINNSTQSSLLPILENYIPGIFVTERGFAGYGVSGGAAGSVNIRGVGQGNKVLFMINGQPQWASFFGHALPDTYVTNGVQRVEVVKGPSSLLYGSNAMAGSINIITGQQKRYGTSGSARAMFGSFNTQKLNLFSGYNNDRLSITVGGQLDRSNGNRKNSEFWLANESAQINYEISDVFSAGSNISFTQSKANNPGTIHQPLEDMWTYISRGTAAIFLNDHFKWGEGGIMTFANWGHHKVDDGHAPNAIPTDYIFHSTDYNFGISLFQTIQPWHQNSLSMGIDYAHLGGNAKNVDKLSDSETHIAKRCENEIAGYVMMQQGLFFNNLSINAGVRIQHGSNYGNVWVPQAGFSASPWSGTTLKFNFSKGFRAPNFKELYMFAAQNPDLKPESMLNYEVSMRQKLFNEKLDIGVALFLIDGKNMIQTNMNNGRPLNENTGSFINKGIEIDGKWTINSLWQIAANYSYLHTNNHSIIGAPKNKLDARLAFTPNNFDLEISSNSVWSLYTGASTTENYELLNLRAAYTFCNNNTKITPFIKLNNFTNNHYEIINGCPMPGITIIGGVEVYF